jgi:hypothetical protein
MAATLMETREAHDRQEALEDFHKAVNMSPSAIEAWLDTDDSKAVGQTEDGEGESTGHAMGRRIVTLLGKKRDDLEAADFKEMRKVTGYVHRHLAQRPDGDVTDTPWRHSLMNWGHDPLK